MGKTNKKKYVPATEEEARIMARVEKIRERPRQHQRTKLYVELKDPNRRHYWARNDDKGHGVQDAKRRGYKITKPEEVKEHYGYESPANSIEIKDAVLMDCPREMFEERMAQRIARDRDLASKQERLEQHSDMRFEMEDRGSKTTRGGKIYNIPLDIREKK